MFEQVAYLTHGEAWNEYCSHGEDWNVYCPNNL